MSFISQKKTGTASTVTMALTSSPCE